MPEAAASLPAPRPGPSDATEARRRRRRQAAARRRALIIGPSARRLSASNNSTVTTGSQSEGSRLGRGPSPTQQPSTSTAPDWPMAGTSQELPDSLRLPRSKPECLSNIKPVFRATRGKFNPISSHRQRKSLADDFHDADGHEIFVTPPDHIKGIPGVTKKKLARFSDWARSPKIKPAVPLSDEAKDVLKRNFRSRYHKRGRQSYYCSRLIF